MFGHGLNYQFPCNLRVVMHVALSESQLLILSRLLSRFGRGTPTTNRNGCAWALGIGGMGALGWVKSECIFEACWVCIWLRLFLFKIYGLFVREWTAVLQGNWVQEIIKYVVCWSIKIMENLSVEIYSTRYCIWSPHWNSRYQLYTHYTGCQPGRTSATVFGGKLAKWF